ncbi:VWA domain-containing protein [Azorhizobium sp. AG788]|uniref:VWA domain-containing protein n=1 Tax=Azorhizobium sp. AG788 TaxID=2183897 RepID=UPI003138F9EC
MMPLPPPLADFHFLRPEWLLAVVPALLLAVLAWRRIGAGRNPWRGLVDAHLLKHLALQETARGRRWPISVLLLGWMLACLAMAGPTWQKLPTPALDHLDPTVIVLSLAQSMNAPDQNPTRLLAARHKVDDILARMRGGQVALVIFADAPFVAAPLTEDGRVIAQMVPELATDLMPVLDDRPDLAIATAVDLLRNAGARTGRIVLIGDGTGDRPGRTQEAAAAAVKAGYTVSAIGVGTPEKTPLLSYDGGTVRNRDGTVRATQMEDERLTQLARTGHGRFTRIAADDSDLDTIFAKVPGALGTSQLQNSGLSADQWLDRGPWLVVALAFLASLAFRRGWIAVLLLAAGLSGAIAPRTASAAPPTGAVSTDPASQDDVFAPPPQASGAAAAPSTGSRWDNLWRTPDQQGARAFENGAYDAAARSFKDPAWQASSQYKSGDYATAASGFERQPGGDYNRGNALARAGKLEDALSAYDAAIAANPNDEDAIFNRDLVQRLLDAQKQQDKDKDKDKDKGQGQGQDQDKDKSPGSDKGDQKKPGDDKSGQDKPGQDKPGKDQKDQAGDQGQKQPDPKGSPADKPNKPEPKKPEPAKPEPQKPEPAKPDPAGKPSQPAKPEPGKDAPGKPAPPQGSPPPPPAPPPPPPQTPPPPAQPPQTPPPRADQPPTAAGALARPLDAQQQQNSEQALRMVPDDPTGLLRARIRSHYLGGIVPVQGVD